MLIDFSAENNIYIGNLGSTWLKTNSTGGVVYESNYEPYGPGVEETGSEDYRYTGKREDPTGLYYYGARYYDPVTGRFTTRDTVFGDLTDPQSPNRYSYCRNNPHKYTDPDGRMAQLALAPVLGPAGLLLITGVFVIAYGPYIMTQIGAISSTSFSLPNIRNQLGFIDNVNENPDTLTLDEDDGEAYWRKKDLKRHQKKHADEMGLTDEEYEKNSIEFMNQPADENTREHERINGDQVRYKKDTNEFGAMREDYSMKTYFYPKRGIDYYWLQLGKHIARERGFTNMEDH